MLRKLPSISLALALVFPSANIAYATITSGSKCRSVNEKQVVKSKIFICVKKGSKLLWQENSMKRSNSIKKSEINHSITSSSADAQTPPTNVESTTQNKVVIETKFIPKNREQWHSELQYNGILQINAFLEGKTFAIVGCATFVYDWGTAKNIAGMQTEQGSKTVELRIDTQDTNTLPRTVTFIDCPSDTQEPSEKNVPNVSFQFDWKINKADVVVSTKVLETSIDPITVKSIIPSSTRFSKGTIRWAETRSAPLFEKGEKTGLSLVTFYADYPFDICEGVFTDGSGNIIPAEMTQDRLNGYGSARFRSPIKQTISYRISCVKSGENSGIIEHTGWLDGRIKVSN